MLITDSVSERNVEIDEFDRGGFSMQLFIILASPLDAGGSSEQMANLIIGAAVIVLVIFAGVVLRRPKS